MIGGKPGDGTDVREPRFLSIVLPLCFKLVPYSPPYLFAYLRSHCLFAVFEACPNAPKTNEATATNHWTYFSKTNYLHPFHPIRPPVTSPSKRTR